MDVGTAAAHIVGSSEPIRSLPGVQQPVSVFRNLSFALLSVVNVSVSAGCPALSPSSYRIAVADDVGAVGAGCPVGAAHSIQAHRWVQLTVW